MNILNTLKRLLGFQKATMKPRKLKLGFMERLRNTQEQSKEYTVRYGVYHDGRLVTQFDMGIKAKSRPHAWAILKTHVVVKPTRLSAK